MAGAKANRVETLMGDIMKSIKNLALNQVFEAVTRKDLKAIEQAVEKLSKIP